MQSRTDLEQDIERATRVLPAGSATCRHLLGASLCHSCVGRLVPEWGNPARKHADIPTAGPIRAPRP